MSRQNPRGYHCTALPASRWSKISFLEDLYHEQPHLVANPGVLTAGTGPQSSVADTERFADAEPVAAGLRVRRICCGMAAAISIPVSTQLFVQHKLQPDLFKEKQPPMTEPPNWFLYVPGWKCHHFSCYFISSELCVRGRGGAVRAPRAPG